ncbi:MAG: hypothetical protein J6R67_03110 [Treponema sp.]|nr:hypothetical protein [Treponema sp.]
MMNFGYKEITRLHEMLINAGIPHEYNPLFGGYHVVYSQDGQRVCSAIEHDYSYGHEFDTIEIMGLLTAEEAEYDDVVGGLSAEDVFNRIQTHHNEHEEKGWASGFALGAGDEVWSCSMPIWD